jgi:hypothetical protein
MVALDHRIQAQVLVALQRRGAVRN